MQIERQIPPAPEPPPVSGLQSASPQEVLKHVEAREPESPLIAPAPPVSNHKLESLTEEILRELRRTREQPQADFSVSKLLAGIVQVVVLAVLFVALLNRSEAGLMPILMFGLTLQAMTIALLIMARQK